MGHFASVSVASADDAFDPDRIIPPKPLWRGHGVFVRFEGLVTVPSEWKSVMGIGGREDQLP